MASPVTQSLQGKLLVTKRDAAFALSVSVRTIENLIAAGELSSRRVGRRRLISVSALLRFGRNDHPTREAR